MPQPGSFEAGPAGEMLRLNRPERAVFGAFERGGMLLGLGEKGKARCLSVKHRRQMRPLTVGNAFKKAGFQIGVRRDRA